jgi:hypothetical protein
MRIRLRVTATVLAVILAATSAFGCGDGDGESVDQESAPTSAPAATARPQSATASAPTAAPARTSGASTSAPQGWKRFSGGGVEVWLPPTFEGGSPSAGDVDAVIQTLRLAGQPEYAAFLEVQKNAVILLMVENDIANFGVSVAASRAPAPSAISLDTIVETNLRQLPAGTTVLQRQQQTVGGLPAVRVTLEIRAGLVAVKEHLYVVRGSSVVWVVVYGAPSESFDRNSATFDQSARLLKFTN